MDYDKAAERVDAFLAQLDLAYHAWDAQKFEDSARREEILRRRQPTIEAIGDRMEAGLGAKIGRVVNEPYTWPWDGVRDATLRLKGLLEDADDLDGILGPGGPTLAAANLHPVVWHAAVDLWDGNHYRQAVANAGAAVLTQLKVKLERHDTDGAHLVREAFSADAPAAQRPRLRFDRYDPGSQLAKDLANGVRDFGVGCVLAVRNIATHDMSPTDEQDALEQLAALSILARWIDEASVVKT